MNTILVQMAEAEWTEEALHLACAMARNTGGSVILLRLFCAQHYSWLGQAFWNEAPSQEESDRLWGYKAIADQYDIDLSIQPMQYATFIEALIDARDQLDTEIVFACIPGSTLPMWQKFQKWNLRRQLAQRHCALYTLDEPVQALILETQLNTLPVQTPSHG